MRKIVGKTELLVLMAALSLLPACSKQEPKQVQKQAAVTPVPKVVPPPKFELSPSERKAALSFFARVRNVVNSCSGSVFSDAKGLGLNNEAGDLDASQGEVCDHTSILLGEMKPPRVRDAAFNKAARELIDSCHASIGAQDEDNDYEAAELNDPNNPYKQKYANDERGNAELARGECVSNQYDFAEELGIRV